MPLQLEEDTEGIGKIAWNILPRLRLNQCHTHDYFEGEGFRCASSYFAKLARRPSKTNFSIN